MSHRAGADVITMNEIYPHSMSLERLEQLVLGDDREIVFRAGPETPHRPHGDGHILDRLGNRDAFLGRGAELHPPAVPIHVLGERGVGNDGLA